MWWIADVHIKNGSRSHTLCFIDKASAKEAETSAKRLLRKHKAVSVELSGPYGRQPTPHTPRR